MQDKNVKTLKKNSLQNSNQNIKKNVKVIKFQNLNYLNFKSKFIYKIFN